MSVKCLKSKNFFLKSETWVKCLALLLAFIPSSTFSTPQFIAALVIPHAERTDLWTTKRLFWLVLLFLNSSVSVSAFSTWPLTPHHPFTLHPLPQLPPPGSSHPEHPFFTYVLFCLALLASVSPPHFNSLFSLRFTLFLCLPLCFPFLFISINHLKECYGFNTN